MISEHAVIHPSAKIGNNVTIGHGSIIGDNVEIGDDSEIGPHVVIQGPTKIGRSNRIFQFASIGDEPQDMTYKGEPTELEIGDNNVIREYCMISRGTIKGGSLTSIGHHNFLMAYAHIGHDCRVGNHSIMVNYSALSGHVTLGDYAIIGAYAAIHQFCHVGAYAFIARATYVTKDVLPYIMIAGHDTSACGINSVGLRRRGFSSATIDELRRAYKIIFRKGLTVGQAIAELTKMQETCVEIQPLIEGLVNSSRGIVR
ncbi:MAG: acyl-[acyl-carrier-protein]--UDP-N-acetylglucosamine O-acyltransferase [Legionellaceae bacterium]|nr:acyl-[acyl-carrier-protein]--UDP-N-acetylglucosamine O-acyltransferase [Legionellaceae bacterium]HAF87278.1 acyl-[acyl-carrier-protein]--UDP-N-acetylglucosamine O-acyltransferase [Legionellales bacterium]HCA90023.1 acyl-[acyl-carrier-protein]--UDP-N-acetylglucosamine O-acyltransferase [Legionellales bacterium]